MSRRHSERESGSRTRARLALTIDGPQGRSARRGPAWPGGDRDERQRLPGVCDRGARTLSGWPRFGMSFGAGVAPQLQAKYNQTIGPNGFLAQQKTYTLKEIPVTPLFEVLFRGDIKVSRNVSIGPIAGLRSGFPVFGGTVRVHLPQNR